MQEVQALGHYIQVPEFVFTYYGYVLDLAEEKVYHRLIFHSWGQGQSHCTISLATLGKECRLSVGTIFTAIRGLLKKGVIEIKNRRNRNQASCYEVFRDGRCNIPPSQEFRLQQLKLNTADKAVIADLSKEPAPADKQLERLKAAVADKFYSEWLEQSKVMPPNALVGRLISNGTEANQKVLRAFFNDLVWTPWLRSILELS